MPDPDLARIDIDHQLEEAGWIVQDRYQMNIFAGEGVPIREVSTPDAGEADYLLVAGGKAIGILEAKAVGTTLKGAENSVHGHGWFRSVVNQQVGQANVNDTKLKALRFPMPPLAEEERIVERGERRLSVIDPMESTVETNLKRMKSLRQSTLRLAFSGRLVRVMVGV
jgi:type I site-specific restriction endonuclease